MTQTPKEIYDVLLRIESRLTKIESKQNELCRNTKSLAHRIERTEDSINALPCDSHTAKMLDEVTQRVPWRQFWQIVGVLILIILSTFTYIHHVDNELQEHRVDALKYLHTPK